MIEKLPALNALFNLTAAVLLCGGYIAIRRGCRRVHMRFMVAALTASALFLGSYLVYHSHVGSVRYEGPARPLYLAILFSHIVLAAAIVPLVFVTVVRAAKGRFETHRRIARWTLPIWLYVSVTGVVIYLMLYGW